MKTTYTNKQLQEAIDRACKDTQDAHPEAGNTLALKPYFFSKQWNKEQAVRLTLARAFFDNLPEPQPPVVDGKTPGQVAYEVFQGQDHLGWEQAGYKEDYEAAASAVLAAFGNQSQAARDGQGEVVDWKERAEHMLDKYERATAELAKSEFAFSNYRGLILSALDEAGAPTHHPDNGAPARKPMTPQERIKALDALSQLRPLSEAGPVPEGCVRVTGYCENGSWLLDANCLATQDTHFADIRLPSTKKSESETFEAHGKTWTRHTPGDPMPCDGGRMIYVLTSNAGESPGPYKAFTYAWTVDESRWWRETIGWRYADEPLVTSPEWTPQAGDVVRLKSGGPLMTVMQEIGYKFLCAYDTLGEVKTVCIPPDCLKLSTKEDAR